MQALWRALRAETLKTQRTLALAMTVLAPLVIALLQLAMILQRPDAYRVAADGNAWAKLGQNCVLLWAILMMPLFVTLETALLSGLDHAGRHWTLLYAQPVPRWAYYAAKQLVGMGLIALSSGVLVIMVVIVGSLLRVLHPGLGFEAPLDLRLTVERAALCWAAAWLLISLQTWIAMRWPSFVVALGSGMAATVVAVFIVEDEKLAIYYPYALPALAVAVESQRTNAVLIGLAAGLLVALLGGWHVTSRDAQ